MRGMHGLKPAFRFPRTRWERQVSSGGFFAIGRVTAAKRFSGLGASEGFAPTLFLAARKEKMPTEPKLR
jgi:hypothetical protein